MENDHIMLEYDEAASTKGKRIFDNGKFLGCKSVLHYIDRSVNEGLFDFLEGELNRYYKDSKYIRLEIDSFNNKKMIGIWLKMSFNENDDYKSMILDFSAEFEQVYQEFEKEFYDLNI